MIRPEIISDLLVNLAAGWLGAVIILPVTIGIKRLSLTALLGNILCGILSLILASWLKG